MSTSINLPDYAKVYEIAGLGLYGHNVISEGETSDSQKVYSSIQCIVSGRISYVSAFPDALIQANTDSVVTNLQVLAGQTLILGCVKNISVLGTGAKVLANLISVNN